MKHCEDCGTKLDGGICPWCHEELYIETYQGEFIERRSDEWNEKVVEQGIQAKANRNDKDR